MTVSVLAQHVAALNLIDNHVHGYWLDAPDRRRFEDALNEPNTASPALGSSSGGIGASLTRCASRI